MNKILWVMLFANTVKLIWIIYFNNNDNEEDNVRDH